MLQDVEDVSVFAEHRGAAMQKALEGLSAAHREALTGIDRQDESDYSYYMKSLKVARIGNSRGVRIPAVTLKRYGIGDEVIMEERGDGILLRPPGVASPKLSWEDTACEMAAADEDWSAWEATIADGLDEIPWDARKRRVAEPKAEYKLGRRPGKP